jgi:hypothetical protein
VSRFGLAGLLVLFSFAFRVASPDLGAAGQNQNQMSTSQELRLVPFPKNVALQPGQFDLAKSLVFEVSGSQGEALAVLLNGELQRAGLPAIPTRSLKAALPAFRVAARKHSLKLPTPPEPGGSESYALDIRADEMVCAARDPAGVFYGLQTLCQLVRANRQGSALPCVQVRDWPSLRWRCFQDDMTRGPSSTLDTLRFEASLGAYLKLNLMTYYMEYQFAFRKHPEIGPTNGSLTPEELTALVDHAKPLHMEVLGNQQSFGHFGRILARPHYAHLRETPEVLTPAREETYQFLDDLYSEVCPRVPFPWFNVCCDETEGLGSGPAKELVASIGVGGVYVRHLMRIHDLLRDKYQKRMMMWGDIILQHPDHLDEIPKDTIMLTWGYDARANFEDQIMPFSRSGYEFFVCPGVSDWNRILPDFGVAITNIQNFVRDGARHGAIGMINTDWQDDGEALKAVKWHADAWAAECAWNASTTSIDAFNRRIGGVLFGETVNEFGKAIELLAQTHRLPGMKGMFNSRFWEKDFARKSGTVPTQTTASNLLAVVRPASRHLEACRQQAKCNQHVLEAFLFGARRMEVIGQRMLDGVQASQAYEQFRRNPADLSSLAQAEQITLRNREAHEGLGRRFAQLWSAESKPYALDWTMNRYAETVAQFDKLLDRMRTLREAVATRQGTPTAEELGLATPKPPFRCVQPNIPTTPPLAPESPWAEPSASHRMGLVVRRSTEAGLDLPVEVEVTLPPDLVAKPVRAFLIRSNEPSAEILAQLEALDSSNKARLVLVLPGASTRGPEALVHAYLGLAQAPSPLPSAARTSAGANDMHCLENDQVRLLLGPEGAHIYRWELKTMGGRDLTMPGESDWAGFSDVRDHRTSVYGLRCRARGPAMVEFECEEAWGHTKTLRLYGGTCWIEVLLSEPTSMYWDFDNPKNFAADGPTPGRWLFSDGQTGAVGREADGVPAQVKAADSHWSLKSNAEGIALGLITPEVGTLHVVAPGAGAGGVGVEGSPPAAHFVTFGGRLTGAPAETMNGLRAALDLKHLPGVRVYSLQAR